ncbi:PIN domain-containing protein [Streptomyces umbrinus]
MIIIDTCVLTRQPWDSPLWELLSAVKASGTQSIAIPEMVLMELLAQRERQYAEALNKAEAAHRNLHALQFSDRDASEHWPAVYSPATFVEKWEEIYRHAFDILPLTHGAAVEALRREAFRIPPAKASGKSATGSRDAAIWMTVLEHAKTCGETIYFVSGNTNDFGKDGSFFPSMADEVAAASASVEYMQDVKELLNRFAEKRDLDHNDPALAARIEAPTTKVWMHQIVTAQVAGSPFGGAVVNFDDHEAPFSEWEHHFEDLVSTPELRLVDWHEESLYSSGESSTLAATVKVLVAGLARRYDRFVGHEVVPTVFEFEARMLFSSDSLAALSVSSTQPVADERESMALGLARNVVESTEIHGVLNVHLPSVT